MKNWQWYYQVGNKFRIITDKGVILQGTITKIDIPGNGKQYIWYEFNSVSHQLIIESK